MSDHYFRGWSEWGLAMGLAMLYAAVPFTVFVALLVLWAGRGDWILLYFPLGVFIAAGALIAVSRAFLRRRKLGR